MKNTPYYILDLESGPLPASKLAEIMPVFEVDKRLKDTDKITADLEKKKADWIDSAALEAHRAEVLAIGLINNGITQIFHGTGEREILEQMADFADSCREKLVVGHNLLGFDIPILVRRMWHHGIKPPQHWLNCTPWQAKWAYDTMVVWSCGHRDQRIKLDLLAWHLGCGRKNGEGKNFAKLYATDQKAALAYLKNDLELTEKIYLKMRFPALSKPTQPAMVEERLDIRC